MNNNIRETSSEYVVACYYFPNYHVDPRNEKRHGKGWTEWELVKSAKSRFKGHQQPKIPLWGYEDESDPKVMAKKIDAAADHGINAFIFDWYWYNDGPFLQRCLEKGYLKCHNNNRLKFSLMWANHDWYDIHPANSEFVKEWHSKNLSIQKNLQFPGAVTPQSFDVLTDYVIENYFKHPSYWLIEGCPYFSVYDIGKLVESFGSVRSARTALDSFRRKVVDAGFKDLHLNGIFWQQEILPGEAKIAKPGTCLKSLGFDSITSYVWIHHVQLNDFPETDYNYVRDRYFKYWEKIAADFELPYFPNITVGWDSTPRAFQSEHFENLGYPYTPVISGNTPARFKEALLEVKKRLDSYQDGNMKICNINCWNEWTEGSCLEPDIVYGTDYLKSLREVFHKIDRKQGIIEVKPSKSKSFRNEPALTDLQEKRD